MIPDDMPIGDDIPEVESEAAEDEADNLYQAAFDAGSASAGREWVGAAIALLTADVEHDPDRLDGAELVAARAEAARMIARIFRGIAADPTD